MPRAARRGALRHGSIRLADGERIAAARDAGLSDAAHADIVDHAALNTLTNYINNAFDTDVDSPLVRPATDARDALARRAA